MRAVARDAKTTLEKIPDQVLPYFQSIAEEMIASRGAVPALSAALAHISGYTQIEVYVVQLLYACSCALVPSRSSQLFGFGLVTCLCNVQKRSLLNATRGFTTFIINVNTEMRGTGYAWNILERHLTPELKESVRGMRMCLDRKGIVFV